METKKPNLKSVSDVATREARKAQARCLFEAALSIGLGDVEEAPRRATGTSSSKGTGTVKRRGAASKLGGASVAADGRGKYTAGKK